VIKQYGFKLTELVNALTIVNRTAIISRTEPLAPACIVEGEELDAETREEHNLTVFDNLQGEVAYALLRSADDINALLAYIQFAAADVLQERQAVNVSTAALPDALTGPGIAVHWGIHPDVWFAANPAVCYAETKTL
jgi:hypothetical protein